MPAPVLAKGTVLHVSTRQLQDDWHHLPSKVWSGFFSSQLSSDNESGIRLTSSPPYRATSRRPAGGLRSLLGGCRSRQPKEGAPVPRWGVQVTPGLWWECNLTAVRAVHTGAGPASHELRQGPHTHYASGAQVYQRCLVFYTCCSVLLKTTEKCTHF